jgi:DNA repair exonuclease SbcCD ATPase subunit
MNGLCGGLCRGRCFSFCRLNGKPVITISPSDFERDRILPHAQDSFQMLGSVQCERSSIPEFSSAYDNIPGLHPCLRCRPTGMNLPNSNAAPAVHVNRQTKLKRRVQRDHAVICRRLLLLALQTFAAKQQRIHIQLLNGGCRRSPVGNLAFFIQAQKLHDHLLTIRGRGHRHFADNLHVSRIMLDEKRVACLYQLIERISALFRSFRRRLDLLQFSECLLHVWRRKARGRKTRPKNVYTRPTCRRRLVGFKKQADNLTSIHRHNYAAVFYLGMVDLKLKRVSIRNWMKFRQVDLEFPEKGLVLVQGINTASGGALLSVGSGKTGLGEALSRTLLGVPGRFTHLKQFSTDKSGNTYVKLEVELHGKPLIVESGYKCKELSPSGDALRYHYDGKQVERGKIDQTREELSKLLGVSPLLAGWTAFIDGDSIKFNRLGQADSVELVMASLRQPPWSAYHEASKKILGSFRRAMALTEGAQQTAAGAVRNAKTEVEIAARQVDTENRRYNQAVKANEENIQRFQRAINSKKQKINEAQLEIAGIAKKLKVMETERAEANHRLEIKLHEVEDALRAAEDTRQPLSEARDKAHGKVVEARIAHNNYAAAGKNCPTCNRPLGQIDPNQLSLLAEKLAEATEKHQKAGAAWTAAEQKVVTLNLQYREVSKQQREISAQNQAGALADRYEELELGINAANNEIYEWQLEMTRYEQGPSVADLKTAQGRLADREAAVVKAQTTLDEAAEALVADQATLKVLEYWNLAFSPYGIPNMVLRDAIAPLNKEARRVSATMTGGTIEVRYSTTRELASGLDKAQLNIEVDNKLGDKDLSGSSKGEAGLTNFVIAETLSEVGQVSRRVGYRWYDEIVPHQDPKVCHSIYAYMKEVAQRLGILVFLVDHNPVAANYADHVLLVEKQSDNGKVSSTIRWR